MATNETVTLTAELKDEMSAPLGKTIDKVDKFTDAVVDGSKKQQDAVKRSTAQIGDDLGKQGRLFGGLKSTISRGLSGTSALFGGMRRDVIGELGRMRKGAEDEGTKAGRGFASSMKGSLSSGLAKLGAAALIAKYVGDAAVSSDATVKFKATMTFAGIDKPVVDKAAKRAQAYADQTVYDLPTIQNMMAQLASNGIKDFGGLTEAAGNLNAIAGGNADTFKSVAMVMSQTAGAGKLTTENWNQLSDAIPGAAGPLMKALSDAGAYTGNFRDAMEKGQISSDEFNTALMKLGTKPVAVEAAKSTETFEGAIGNLNATINNGLMKALDSVKPQITALIGWLADAAPVLLPLAAGIGAVVAVMWALNGVLAVAAVVGWPVTVAILAITAGLALLIGAVVWAYNNVDWFRAGVDAAFKWIGEAATNVGNWITTAFQNVVSFWQTNVSPVIDWLVNTIFRPAFDWIGRLVWNTITVVVSIFQHLVSFWQTNVQPVIDTVVGWFRDGIAGAITFLKPVIDGLVAGFQGFIDFWSQTLKPVTDAIGNAFKWVGDMLKPVLDGIGQFANNPLGGIQDWLGIKKDGNGQGIMPSNSGGGVYSGGGVAFAGGGVLGGYAPGHDSILARLSPGESVLVPELTRALGPRNIMAANAAASGGRPAGSGPSLTSGHSRGRGGSSTTLVVQNMQFNVPVTAAGSVDMDALREATLQTMQDALDSHNRRAY